MTVVNEIEKLTLLIANCPSDTSLLMQRGKAYQKIGDNDKAINDFVEVCRKEPLNREAQTYIELLTGIFEFSYGERYNP